MRYLLTLFAVFVALQIQSQNFSEYQYRWFISPNTKDTLPYRVLYPKGYDGTKAYPLVLFLHGAGERGNDNESQLKWGAELFLQDSVRNNFPAFVLIPQCAADDYWVRREETFDSAGQKFFDWPFYEKPTPSMQLVMELVRHFVQQENVDVYRMYVTGLSMGGMGTLDIIARLPGIFAAAAPICGGGNALLTPIYSSRTSVWLFHGAKDQNVLPRYSKKIYRALLRLNADAKYTEYPDAEHDCWHLVFKDPKFLEWLFSKKSKKWGVGE